MASLDADLRAQLRPCRPARAELRDATHSGLSTLWLSSQGVVSAAVIQSLLMASCGSATLGLYAAADRVRGGVQGLFTAFGTAVFPRLVQQRLQGHAAGQRTAWSLLRLQLLAAAVGALALLAGAPAVVAVVSGPAYVDTVPLLRVLALTLISTTLLSGLGLQLMVPQGQTRLYGRAMLLLLLLQVIALAALAPARGALGAAWALLLCEGAVGLALLVFMVRRPA
jgi:O-antigen/teichoic acid export membrane protein